eukprot:COSAG01_NODE_11795_length_1857_cov_14.547782_1_plen_178_part_00
MFMGVYILIMKLFRCATLHCSSHPKGYRVARCKTCNRLYFLRHFREKTSCPCTTDPYAPSSVTHVVWACWGLNPTYPYAALFGTGPHVAPPQHVVRAVRWCRRLSLHDDGGRRPAAAAAAASGVAAAARCHWSVPCRFHRRRQHWRRGRSLRTTQQQFLCSHAACAEVRLPSRRRGE